LAALKALDQALDQAAEKRAAMPPRAAKKSSNKNELIVTMLNLFTPEQIGRIEHGSSRLNAHRLKLRALTRINDT
jgi:hypothetical protein